MTHHMTIAAAAAAAAVSRKSISAASNQRRSGCRSSDIDIGNRLQFELSSAPAAMLFPVPPADGNEKTGVDDESGIDGDESKPQSDFVDKAFYVFGRSTVPRSWCIAAVTSPYPFCFNWKLSTY